MEYLPNGYTLELAEGCFPLSTDSMLLAHFVKLPRQASVLDLGAGCGTIGLTLCATDGGCTVTGIELDETAHRMAQHNIHRNGLEGRMASICADLRQITTLTASGSFDCCVSNPPYFSGGPASKATPLARREDCCHIEDLMKSAAWALKFGGNLFLVQKPERLPELIVRASEQNLELKRLRLVRHRENGPIALILMQFKKGGKPGMVLEENCLFDANGVPTPYYRSVYHIESTPHPL